MGYFQMVNFVFSIVGHTKNAAERLFDSLKTEYCKQNIFTMQGMIQALSASNLVTVVQSDVEDFWDYNTLFFEDLSCFQDKKKIITSSLAVETAVSDCSLICKRAILTTTRSGSTR